MNEIIFGDIRLGVAKLQRRPCERRDPYVDGPRAARVFRWSDRIACIHMSGLLVRLVDRWPRWFSAMRAPNTAATFTGQWVPRIFSHLGSIDLPSVSFCSSGSTGWRPGLPADLLGGELRCQGHPLTVVTLARRQQLPGNAGRLVGKCHRCKFRRLARQQRYEPRRRTAAAFHRLLDH